MKITQPQHAAGPAMSRAQRITIYPNLVKQKQFWIQFYYVDRCVFSVQLYTLNGQEVYRRFFHHGSYHATHAVQLPFQLKRGIYRLALRSERISWLQPLVIG